MLKMRILALVTLLALVVAPFAGVRAADDTIVDIAIKDGKFKTLVAAVQAAGLVDTLKGAGPFTVFAPTDAFKKVPAPVLEYLLKPENKALLTRVLTYHVVSGSVMAADVMGMNGKKAKTVETGEITVTIEGKNVRVNSANVIATDVKAANGVIHVIDTVIIPAIELPKVDPLTVKGNILTAGSSTVFPLARDVADRFRKDGFADNIEIASVGTGAGFERFCTKGETDVSNASAKIKQAEIDNCKKINRDPIEFHVAIDALAVVVGKDTPYVKNLTKAQIKDIFSGKFKTWKEVDASYPEDAIKLFSPGTDSGTFEYFVEAIFAKDKKPILDAKPQLSEDDNVLVQGVAGTKGAIGYFGFAYYSPNKAKLTAVSVDGVEASEANAEAGKYPLSRPLFIYTTAKIMTDKPQVAAYVNYFLTNGNKSLVSGGGKVNYFPINSDAAGVEKLEFLAATAAAKK
jgi:phosphate binding protein